MNLKESARQCLLTMSRYLSRTRCRMIPLNFLLNPPSTIIQNKQPEQHSMAEPHKKIKTDKLSQKTAEEQPDFSKIYEDIRRASQDSEDHPYVCLLQGLRAEKTPILQVIQSHGDVFKSNPEKKKKPVQLYLDTVNHLYRKRELDILINPVTPTGVFENWAPREVAIFEQGLLKFGKQFQFIAELIRTKNVKEVYEFYWEWKSTSHYKSYRTYCTSNNRHNIEDII